MTNFLDIRSYDYDERVKAFWEGENVQLENDVIESFIKVTGCKIIKELNNTKIVCYNPPLSELDSLFN